MKNVVAFETAKRLKEAGFPQPDFQPMQFWYDDGIKGACPFRLYIVLHVGRFPAGQLAPLMHEICEKQHDQARATHANFGEYQYAAFAPTATDIMLDIEYADLTFRKGEWRATIEHVVEFHTNPAEAAALAWLELNKKNLEV